MHCHCIAKPLVTVNFAGLEKKLRSCWASRWRPATASLDRRGRWPGARQRLVDRGLCGARGLARQRATPPRRLAAPPATLRPRPCPARALTGPQQQAVLDLLHAPRFADQAPAEIYASLLDEGVYYCSVCTMYRLLGQNGEIRERRAQLRHPAYQKPELLAKRPNKVWSWDITKLMGPAKWSHFYFYVILDIFSRRVVGWCVADAESAALFRPLLDDAIAKHDVPPGQLTLHADRGGPMKARATALLLADLGVTRSHNRPHTSNDNPSPKATSRRSSISRAFPSASAASRTPRASATGSLIGTTRTTTTPGSAS